MSYQNLTNSFGLISSESCSNWCILQHVTGYNNIETIYVLFVAGALICIILYETFAEFEKTKSFAPYFISFAKYLLYIFFFAYIFILKLRLYYYLK